MSFMYLASSNFECINFEIKFIFGL